MPCFSDCSRCLGGFLFIRTVSTARRNRTAIPSRDQKRTLNPVLYFTTADLAKRGDSHYPPRPDGTDKVDKVNQSCRGSPPFPAMLESCGSPSAGRTRQAFVWSPVSDWYS